VGNQVCTSVKAGVDWSQIVYNRRFRHKQTVGLRRRIKRNLEPTNSKNERPLSPLYWRVEGSLVDLTTVEPIAFFTWNAQTFTERWVRRGLVFVMAVLRPFLYAANRVFATRVVHAVLR
jgi:hypothetical protein